MSKDLTLWEDDESDVRIEYRLQYGHVLVASHEINRILKNIRSVFKLGKTVLILNEVQSERLPYQEGCTLLNNDSNWHFIFAQIGSNVAVFGPHILFLGSYGWTIVSRKLKVELACILADFDVFYYTIFRRGKHICNAARTPSDIHQSKMSPMEFYMNGKLFYKVDEEEDKLTPELIKFISEDVIIDVDEQRQVRFKTPLSENKYRKPTAIRHVIFATQ